MFRSNMAKIIKSKSSAYRIETASIHSVMLEGKTGKRIEKWIFVMLENVKEIVICPKIPLVSLYIIIFVSFNGFRLLCARLNGMNS